MMYALMVYSISLFRAQSTSSLCLWRVGNTDYTSNMKVPLPPSPSSTLHTYPPPLLNGVGTCSPPPPPWLLIPGRRDQELVNVKELRRTQVYRDHLPGAALWSPGENILCAEKADSFIKGVNYMEGGWGPTQSSGTGQISARIHRSGQTSQFPTRPDMFYSKATTYNSTTHNMNPGRY